MSLPQPLSLFVRPLSTIDEIGIGGGGPQDIW